MNKQIVTRTAVVFIALGGLILSAFASAQTKTAPAEKPLIWSSQDRRLYAPRELPPERLDDFAMERPEFRAPRDTIIDMDLR